MSATPEGEFTGLEVQDHVLLEEATKTCHMTVPRIAGQEDTWLKALVLLFQIL